jgi:hypothetical protein
LHPVRGGSRDRQYVSIRDLRERNFLQFRISQKPLERGVFTLKAVEPLDPSPRPGLVYAAAETAIERPGPQGVAVASRIKALPQVEGLSNSG